MKQERKCIFLIDINILLVRKNAFDTHTYLICLLAQVKKKLLNCNNVFFKEYFLDGIHIPLTKKLYLSFN